MGKNIYIGVDNVARKVKQPIIGVDNIARNVKSGFIGVDNVARQFFSGGTPLSSLAVGTSVYLNESGTAKEYIIVNQGIPSNSSLYDSTCNGTWLLRKIGDKDFLQVWYSRNRNTYANSDVHTWLNSTMLSRYDASVQNLIKQAIIPYGPGNQSLTVNSGANGLSCKLFLLSAYEVGFTDLGQYVPVEGAALSYFNGADNSKRIFIYSGNGANTLWWLRTPVETSNKRVSCVYKDGTYKAYDSELSYYARPALILPFETLIDENMNIIAT